MKNRASVQNVFIEVVSIIVAVILGFVVNEWRENHNDRKAAETAVQRIMMEIEQNHAQLQDRYAYYTRILGAIDSLKSVSHDIRSTADVPGWTGINPPVMSASSYLTASSIGVFSSVDFETADHIAKLYIMQDELHQLGSTSIQSLISGTLFRDSSVQMLFIVYQELIDGWFGAYRRLSEIM